MTRLANTLVRVAAVRDEMHVEMRVRGEQLLGQRRCG